MAGSKLGEIWMEAVRLIGVFTQGALQNPRSSPSHTHDSSTFP